jgi:hypothetical protein
LVLRKRSSFRLIAHKIPSLAAYVK